jgi:hypothetical protein
MAAGRARRLAQRVDRMGLTVPGDWPADTGEVEAWAPRPSACSPGGRAGAPACTRTAHRGSGSVPGPSARSDFVGVSVLIAAVTKSYAGVTPQPAR